MIDQKPFPPIAFITIMAMVSPIALNILLPALPAIAEELNIPIASVQLSFSLYLLALAIGQLICGALADRFGRRPVLIAGVAIHFIGCIVGAMAEDLSALLIARVLQALGGCTGMVLARTIMLDRFNRDQAAGKLGYITLSIALSQAIAPTLGGHLNLYIGWQSLFYFSMALSSVSWLIVIFLIPETVKDKTDSLRIDRVLKQYWEVLKAPNFLGYALATTFIACGFYFFIGSAPYIVNSYMGGSSADFGNWFLVVSLGFMLGSFIAARISAKLGTQNMIKIGQLFALTGATSMLLLIYLFGFHYSTLFLPMALFTVGRGMSQPNSQSAAISSSQTKQGSTSGLMGFIQLLAGAATAQVTPLILAIHPMLIFVLLVCCPLLAFVAYSKTRTE